MYCSKCGKKLRSDAIYCDRCGINLHKKKENIPFIVITVFLIIVLLTIFCILILTDNPSNIY